jgi:hypothetical protein
MAKAFVLVCSFLGNDYLTENLSDIFEILFVALHAINAIRGCNIEFDAPLSPL